MSTENDWRADSKTFQIVAVVIAAVIAVGVVVYVCNREKVGKSSNPAVQQESLKELALIPIKLPNSKSGYSREQFGKPWTNEVDGVKFGRNRCDTRQVILRRDLSNVMPPSGCAVQSGILHDPYTGKNIVFNRDEGTDVLVQIDHIVALVDAWQTGAQQWDQFKRTQFANDPMELLAVDGKSNRKKKAANVASWLPSNKDYRCEYVTSVVKVKAKYGLWMVQTEHDEAYQVLSKCSAQATYTSTYPSPSGILPSVGTRFPSSSAAKRPN